jgi:WD40 repeat protein
MSATAGAPTTPFKGLAAFQDTELDALLFCGREREREVVVANLLASRLTVLYGASGVGKTSLLRAAVAHSLGRVHNAVVVVYSSWAGDPRAGFGEVIDTAAGIESRGTLVERLGGASRAVEGDVYVILDQFEEYFLYHERDAFAAELAAAIREPGLRANFLLGLREDALAKLDAFKGQLPNLFANYLRLDHLDRHGGRAAILGPIDRYNELTGQEIGAEPELVEAVLDQVAAGRVDVGRAGRGGVEADEERIEAPYLQLVLERLWEVERERGSTVLRLATLRELGGSESIVRAHLERALGRLQPAEQDVAATMFDHLVTPSGSKIAHRPGDLAQYAAVRETDVMPVLDALGRERIVRAVDGAGRGERYEIFHDVLADGVLAWRARRELERDRELARKRQRRLAILAAGALLGLAAMTGVALYALTERSHARSAARQARARAFEATALAGVSTDPQRALADAVAAARISPGTHAEDVLRQMLVATRLRHVLPAGGPVSAVAFASRGGRMLTGSADGRVRIYSAEGSLERTLLIGPSVEEASFSPNGDLVVAAGGREASVWSVAGGTRLQTLHLPGVATSATFSPDGRLVLTTAARGGSAVWDTHAGRHLATLKQGPVSTGTFSPNGRLIATVDASEPHRARIFDTSSGRLLHTLAPGASPKGVELTGVEFSPNGRLLATTSYQGTYLWNPRTGKRVGRRLEDKPGLVTVTKFSPNGALLAAAGQDGAVRIWDVASGQPRFFLPDHTEPIDALAWSPDGRFVADGSLDRTLHVWALEGPLSGQRVGDLVGHRGAVTSIAYSRDGRSLLSGSNDHTARLWDARFDEELVPLHGMHRFGAVKASFGPGGRRVVSAGADGTARIWDVQSRRLVHTLLQKAGVNDAEFSPNGRLVVTASADGSARIWNASTGSALHTLRAHGAVLVARFSPDGAIVATGDAKGGVKLWRTKDGRLLANERQQGKVADAAFAPDGRTLATAGPDGASVWSVSAGRQIRLLRSPGGLSRVAFSPDGSLIAGAGGDGAARIWDAASGKRPQLLPASKHALTDVVFSPDGQLLLVTGAAPAPLNATMWDVPSGRRLHPLVGHTGPVAGGAFSRDGRWIVTTGGTAVGLWQRDASQPYFYLRSTGAEQDKHLTSSSFSPDGRFVLSSSEDGSVRLYRCEICGDLDSLLRLADIRLREWRS